MLLKVRSALRVAGWAAAVLLVCFHGWLFAGQVAEGRLIDPWLAFRWLAAAALVASLIGIRRGGRSIWSRQGISIWVLAALLHGPAVAGVGDRLDPFALPDAVVTSIVQVVSSAALALTLWMLAGVRAHLRRNQLRAARAYVFVRSASHLAAVRSRRFSRPPPR